MITTPIEVVIENRITRSRFDLEAWTATYSTGLLRAPNCDNWANASSGIQGNYGEMQHFDWQPWKWTEFAAQECRDLAQLYCFEI